MTQLLTLDLGHNVLTVLPGVVGKLVTLREINLCYNMLDSLPKEMALLPYWTYPRDPKVSVSVCARVSVCLICTCHT